MERKEPPRLRRGPEHTYGEAMLNSGPRAGSTLRIATLVKKLMRKRAPRRVCSRRPVQTRLDEELVVRLSAKGKKLVRQRAPHRQRMNLEEFQRRGAKGVYGINTNAKDGK